MIQRKDRMEPRLDGLDENGYKNVG